MSLKANCAGWNKFLTTILLLLLTFAVSAGQVIDFGNVTPDQAEVHGSPISASGADGVEVTVEFINIETSNVVNSGLYSVSTCDGTEFIDDFGGTDTYSGPTTAGCATSDLIDNKYAVRLTFSEIGRLDPTSSLTNEDEVVFEVTLSGPVTGLSTANFALETTGLSGTSVAAVSGSGDTYEVTVDTGSGDGTVRLDLDNAVGKSQYRCNPLHWRRDLHH